MTFFLFPNLRISSCTLIYLQIESPAGYLYCGVLKVYFFPLLPLYRWNWNTVTLTARNVMNYILLLCNWEYYHIYHHSYVTFCVFMSWKGIFNLFVYVFLITCFSALGQHSVIMFIFTSLSKKFHGFSLLLTILRHLWHITAECCTHRCDFSLWHSHFCKLQMHHLKAQVGDMPPACRFRAEIALPKGGISRKEEFTENKWLTDQLIPCHCCLTSYLITDTYKA